MLAGLTQTLKAGDQFPLTLVFEHGGKVTTTVTVKPMGTVE
jgi:copper(I)-binding protein